MVDSIFSRDYQVVQGLTLVIAVLVSLLFLAVDIVPRHARPAALGHERERRRHGARDRRYGRARAKRPGLRILAPALGGALLLLFPSVLRPTAGEIAPYDPIFSTISRSSSRELAHPFGTTISAVTCCRG